MTEHGTHAAWHGGCRCAECRAFRERYEGARKRRKAAELDGVAAEMRKKYGARSPRKR